MTLAINGVERGTFSSGKVHNFDYVLDLPPADGEQGFDIVVSDAQGQQVQRSQRVLRDTRPPIIAISTAGVAAAPGVTQVNELPFPLSGTLEEGNIAAFTINGQSVALVPTALADVYDFSVNLNLPAGSNQAVALVAQDLAGHQEQIDLILYASAATQIDLVAPREGAVFALDASAPSVEVLARLS